MKKALFECPLCKKAPRRTVYPRKFTWKTQRGLDNHDCYADAEKRAQAAVQEEDARQEAWRKWLALGLTERKVGDRVIISGYVVTSPTHKNGRRVRYEELRRYFAREGQVTAILKPYAIAEEALAKGDRIAGVRYEVDHGVLGVDFHPTMEAATASAEKQAAGYDEHLELSRACR